MYVYSVFTLEGSCLTFYLGLCCTKIVLQAQVDARVNTTVSLPVQSISSIWVICPYSYNTRYRSWGAIPFISPATKSYWGLCWSVDAPTSYCCRAVLSFELHTVMRSWFHLSSLRPLVLRLWPTCGRWWNCVLEQNLNDLFVKIFLFLVRLAGALCWTLLTIMHLICACSPLSEASCGFGLR